MPPTALLPHTLLPRRARDVPDPVPVITVRGELDFGTVGRLCRCIDDHAGRRRHLRVDLSGATFYDQAAADALTLAASRARHAGCRVVWVDPPPRLVGRHTD